MYRTLLIAAALVGLASPAHATNARMAALSNNAGFIDDTDIFLYPSTLSDLPARATLNYDSGAFDGGFTLDDGRALWFQRHNPTGPESGFRALYGKASGSTGYLVRASQDPATSTFTVGGAWSNGPGRGTPKNLAVDGDLRLIGALTDDLEFGLNAAVTSRTLEKRRMTVWTAGLDVDTATELAQLNGAYTIGPRFAVDDARLALQVGPALNVTLDTSGSADPLIGLAIPYANFAGEYRLREWFRLRGSVTSSWVGNTDTGDLIDNFAWSNVVGGAFGVGFTHNRAQFDMTVNPTWALNGPHVLSGTPNPMFGVLSARVDL